jgi:hypothetical protein
MDPILYWNEVALEANRISHTAEEGEQRGPTLSSRALAIVHLAMHDAFYGVSPSAAHGLYLPGQPYPSAGTNPDAAVATAACTALAALYPSQRHAFERAMTKADVPSGGAPESAEYGRAVGKAIVDKLAVKAGEPGASDAGYSASLARGRHRVDPDNPGQGFHAPFYGETATTIAAHGDHALDAPPSPFHQADQYEAALDEVVRLGGAPGLPTTTRKPEGTLIGLYWAYDGVPGIGTPPRLYNQIVRKVAKARNNTPADNARLFALVNAAMGDAGKFAWREKYKHDLWRPVLGVRECAPSTGPAVEAGRAIEPPCDPFWLPLGAPRTNTRDKGFTPPFPAYPSGHATFGAAALQMVRLFYKCPRDSADAIAFELVSDELDGISTDMNGTVRTRHERKFDSLWQAIFENGQSRVFLGVHWVFDAFPDADVKDGAGCYKDPKTITYTKQVGGVKLGLDIANDIWDSCLVCPDTGADEAPAAALSALRVNVERDAYPKRSS